MAKLPSRRVKGKTGRNGTLTNAVFSLGEQSFVHQHPNASTRPSFVVSYPLRYLLPSPGHLFVAELSRGFDFRVINEESRVVAFDGASAAMVESNWG